MAGVTRWMIETNRNESFFKPIAHSCFFYFDEDRTRVNAFRRDHATTGTLKVVFFAFDEVAFDKSFVVLVTGVAVFFSADFKRGKKLQAGL